MSIKSAPLYTDMSALTRLKIGSAQGDSDNLREVARQFESLFTHMLMKNMRAAGFGDGVFDSEQGKFYQDMFDQQISSELSRGPGLGIAELLVRQLGQAQNASPSSADAAAGGAPVRSRPLAATAARRTTSGPVEFVRRLLPHARRVGRAIGVSPKFILAQAALETGWGKKPIRNVDGSDSHNLFGMKTGKSWRGPHAVVNTLEFAAGVGRRVQAAFRSYSSASQSFDDYARLLRGSSRYADALQTGEDGAAFATALERGGYATDPDYASKILRIAGGETLRNAMSVLKNP